MPAFCRLGFLQGFMAINILNKLFGSRNDRQLKRMSRQVARINELEPDFKALSDEALCAKTDEFRQRLVDGETLDGLLPEAFAAVREAAWRALEMRPFDVQLIGGMVLHGAELLKCAPVRARHWWPRCRPT